MTPNDELDAVEGEESVEKLLPYTNILTHCIYTRDSERLVKCFEDDEDIYRESAVAEINNRDDEGRTPLDLAAILGREDIMKVLVERGADICLSTEQGYTVLHYAAAWGKVNIVKALVELQADLNLQNNHGERARETALRYNNTECVDYLDWAEARTEMLVAIKKIQDTMADPEQVQGRLGKEDKILVTGLIREKNEWLERTPDATTQDFIDQKQEVDEALEPIYVKLKEPLIACLSYPLVRCLLPLPRADHLPQQEQIIMTHIALNYLLHDYTNWDGLHNTMDIGPETAVNKKKK